MLVKLSAPFPIQFLSPCSATYLSPKVKSLCTPLACQCDKHMLRLPAVGWLDA
uniref:Uncharacterized protein n=1 Tax=Rhizophora mucronata TaxID=61149 RepID=A0A2P2P8E5_RHIMU